MTIFTALPTQEPDSVAPLLTVENLRIELSTGTPGTSGNDVVSDISFELRAGEILGLVGESGSGKTSIATALLGHVRAGARISHGRVRIAGHDILTLDEPGLRQIRGGLVSHVAQDPAMALNPLLRIGRHLDDVLAAHQPHLSRGQRQARALQVLEEVGLPGERELLRRFPHQLSGGQQQRVQLALAFVLRPRLIVLDEPTTALDVITQAKVLQTLRSLCRQHGVAAVYVSHDLSVISQLVDRVIVLYAGRVVESAARQTLFERPAHPYSQGLLAAVTDVAQRRALQPIPGQAPAPGTRPAGCAFAPRCPLASAECSRTVPQLTQFALGHQAACLHLHQPPAFSVSPVLDRPAQATRPAPLLHIEGLSAWYGARQVLFDAGFDLAPGECLALVGESGSGKTTLSRALAGLGDNASGQVQYQGQPLALRARQRTREVRHQVQYIFQNPYRALNPRHTVGQTLRLAVQHFFRLTPSQLKARLEAVLAQVSLPADTLHAYPRELSGGERQRVAIARALICQPRLLICDEITSALDVSVQASILALLRDLQAQGLAILFVTHDLGVVRAIADRVAVLHQGYIVEQGPVGRVLDRPLAPYTESLLRHSPSVHSPVQQTTPTTPQLQPQPLLAI